MANSLYQAAIVFTSQNFGAQKFERIKKIIIICITYVFGLWLAQIAVTFFGGEFLVGLYIPDSPEAVEMAMRKFNVIGYTYAFLAMMNIMSGVLRGMGASFINMITAIIGTCGIRIVWILTVFKTIRSFEVLYLCYPLSWAGTFLMHTIMVVIVFKKSKAALSCQH